MASLRPGHIRDRAGRDHDPGIDQTIGIYSPERSIADGVPAPWQGRIRMARDALREWLRRGGKPARLIEIASRLPRAKSPILQALDMLG